MHASANPIIVPPTNAKTNPKTAMPAKRSFSSRGEKIATHNGPVETNTTELATDVYSSDDIHVAKWMARKMPEMIPSTKS